MLTEEAARRIIVQVAQSLNFEPHFSQEWVQLTIANVSYKTSTLPSSIENSPTAGAFGLVITPEREIKTISNNLTQITHFEPGKKLEIVINGEYQLQKIVYHKKDFCNKQQITIDSNCRQIAFFDKTHLVEAKPSKILKFYFDKDVQEAYKIAAIEKQKANRFGFYFEIAPLKPINLDGETLSSVAVMDRARGRDLMCFLMSEGDYQSQNLSAFIFILIELREFLKTTYHDKKYAHLDVKPENVMVSKDQPAKLVDFGTITRIGDSEPECGTRDYVCPNRFNITTGDWMCDHKIQAMDDNYSVEIANEKIIFHLLPHIKKIEGRTYVLQNFSLIYNISVNDEDYLKNFYNIIGRQVKNFKIDPKNNDQKKFLKNITPKYEDFDAYLHELKEKNKELHKQEKEKLSKIIAALSEPLKQEVQSIQAHLLSELDANKDNPKETQWIINTLYKVQQIFNEFLYNPKDVDLAIEHLKKGALTYKSKELQNLLLKIIDFKQYRIKEPYAACSTIYLTHLENSQQEAETNNDALIQLGKRLCFFDNNAQAKKRQKISDDNENTEKRRYTF